MVAYIAMMAVGQSSLSAEALREADAFFARNQKAAVPAVTRTALATFIQGASAYRKKDYAQCARVLDSLWREFPMGTAVWNTRRRAEASFNLGRPECYYALLMLDEACRWRLSAGQSEIKAKPIVLQVVLIGRSRGVQPRTMAELKAGTGELVVKTLGPELTKDSFKVIRDSTWLFQEYVLAITKGKAKLDVAFTHAKDQVVPVVASFQERAFSSAGELIPKLREVRETLKVQPDWWWVIYPSQVPDQFPDFARTEFVTGGMGSGPDGMSPLFIIDDQWLVRRPPHMGQGRYEALERDIYLPNWLQHEFFHHLFGRYGSFELEKTSHQWFNRSTWPSDFVGMFEPDYYREALHKRIQAKGAPLHVQLRYAPPELWLRKKIADRDLIGRYEHQPRENAWHSGAITFDGSTYRWTNEAGVSWTLHPRVDSWLVSTGPENPYAKQGITEFTMVLKRGSDGDYDPSLAGFGFNGAFYRKLE